MNNMKKIEIVDKDVVRPKLTVSKNRVTIKFPLNYDNIEKEELAKKLIEVSKKMEELSHTLRGRVSNQMTISMQNSRKEVVYTFDLKEI
jgi:hypothetical protein